MAPIKIYTILYVDIGNVRGSAVMRIRSEEDMLSDLKKPNSQQEKIRGKL